MRGTLKKGISLALALMLCAGLLPGRARAAEDALPDEPASAECVAPEIMPDEISDEPPAEAGAEEELPADLPPAEEPAMAAETGGMTVDTLAAALKAAVAARQASVTFSFAAPEPSDYALKSLLDSALALAFVHTGVPTEGDYLRHHFSGFYWTNRTKWTQTEDGYVGTATIPLYYYDTAAQEAAVDTAIAELYAALALDDKSDYEAVRAVYDWMCANITYEDTGASAADFTRYSAYGALVSRRAACQGYSLLFYRLMLMRGIDARFIGGDGHAWNIVNLGDVYYNADTTWDAGSTSYIYFLRCPAKFYDHTRAEEYETPAFHAAYPMADRDYLADAVVASGGCGEGVTWTLYESSTLVISGHGAMADYSYGTQPWSQYSSRITAVIVEEGITALGAWAFANGTKLSSVTLPDGLERIGDHAFYFCAALADIDLPAALTTIGTFAFNYCQKLTSVVFPAGLVSIGSDGFSSCAGLRTVYFEGNAPTIGSYAFSGVTATVYYYDHTAGWTQSVMKGYGSGTLSWVMVESALCDINGDGRASIQDAMLVMQAVVSLITLDESARAAADADNDGAVTCADALIIARYAIRALTPAELMAIRAKA